MSQLQELLQMGVEVRREGPGLRLVWHREPTPELRELIRANKEALLSELAQPGNSQVEEQTQAPFSTQAPTDAAALSEFEAFTLEEKKAFFWIRFALVDEGEELHRAERDAAAAVLQHRRLHEPIPFWVVKALHRGKKASQ